jgi:hypothetical protein
MTNSILLVSAWQVPCVDDEEAAGVILRNDAFPGPACLKVPIGYSWSYLGAE